MLLGMDKEIILLEKAYPERSEGSCRRNRSGQFGKIVIPRDRSGHPFHEIEFALGLPVDPG
jgi:hypothetical protein